MKARDEAAKRYATLNADFDSDGSAQGAYYHSRDTKAFREGWDVGREELQVENERLRGEIVEYQHSIDAYDALANDPELRERIEEARSKLLTGDIAEARDPLNADIDWVAVDALGKEIKSRDWERLDAALARIKEYDREREALLELGGLEIPPTDSARGIKGYASGYNDALADVRKRMQAGEVKRAELSAQERER